MHIEQYLESLLGEGVLVSAPFEQLVVADPEIYRMEEDLAAVFTNARLPCPVFRDTGNIDRLLDTLGLKLNPEQREAVRNVLRFSISLMTGGAGCGKTYSVSTIASIAAELELKVVLAAPTGKAAQRLEEVVRHPASTIHRLLGFGGGGCCGGWV